MSNFLFEAIYIVVEEWVKKSIQYLFSASQGDEDDDNDQDKRRKYDGVCGDRPYYLDGDD